MGNQVDVAGTVIKVSDKAVLVEVGEVDGREADGSEVWFPKSKCPDLEDAEEGDDVEFECPEWLAEEKYLL
jgi:hypothetical protein